MTNALRVIRGEHRSIAAVLHGIEHLVRQARTRRATIDPRVFRAMLYYLDTFSERMHHPKEDRLLFSPLRRLGAGAEALALIAELEAEHAQGGESLRRIEQGLMRYEEGGQAEFPEFARELERFVQGYRDHMRKEEERIFPLVEALFTASDWAELARGYAENDDPLASMVRERSFQTLFSRIVKLAPPPVGVGPDT